MSNNTGDGMPFWSRLFDGESRQRDDIQRNGLDIEAVNNRSSRLQTQLRKFRKERDNLQRRVDRRELAMKGLVTSPVSMTPTWGYSRRPSGRSMRRMGRLMVGPVRRRPDRSVEQLAHQRRL